MNEKPGEAQPPTLSSCLKEELSLVFPDLSVDEFLEKGVFPVLSTSKDLTAIDECRQLLISVCCDATLKTKGGNLLRHEVLRRYFDCEITKLHVVEAHLAEACISSSSVAEYTSEKLLGEQLESVLLEFGSIRPKDFMELLTSYFINAKHRLICIGLLVNYFQGNRTNVSLIVETGLLELILKSLEMDEDRLLLHASTILLCMVIVECHAMIAANIARIFRILVVLVVKKMERDKINEREFEDKESAKFSPDDDGFEKALEEDNMDFQKGFPDTLNLYTMLYGMFPLNMLKFISSPRAYLNEHTVKALEFDNETIRLILMPVFQQHLCNEYTVKNGTVEQELEDLSRFTKLDPDAFYAYSLSLRSFPATIPSLNNNTKNGNTSEFNGMNSSLEPLEHDSDVESTEKINTSSNRDTVLVNEIMDKETKFLTRRTGSSSQHTLSVITTSYTPMESVSTVLKREVLLLRNELEQQRFFELRTTARLRQLYEENLAQKKAESYRLSIYQTCRQLQTDIKRYQDELHRQRGESATLKSKYIKWEKESNDRIRALRNERKEKTALIATLNEELRECKSTIKNLNQQYASSQISMESLRQELEAARKQYQSDEEKNHHLKHLEKQLVSMTESNQRLQEKDAQLEVLQDILQAEGMKLNAAENQINELSTKNRELMLKISLFNEVTKSDNIKKSDCDMKAELLCKSYKNQIINLKRELEEISTKFKSACDDNVQLETRLLQLKAQLETSTARRPRTPSRLFAPTIEPVATSTVGAVRTRPSPGSTAARSSSSTKPSGVQSVLKGMLTAPKPHP